jgi:3-carboxy-cis,cis-muconate cycloisomerase
MAARTLLQQAVPTTFGLVAAGWLVAVLDARDGLDDAARAALVVQLGGAAGTLAALGPRALEVVAGFARELGLGEPALPWHADRTRIVRLAGALDVAAGALAGIALDVVLLSQTEVGELAGGGGGSSTMPHKRNPAGAVRTRAAARQARGHTAVLREASEQELQRAAGAWQAEPSALSGALALTGGAAASLVETLDGLQVDADRMRANLEATRGLVLSERVTFALAGRLGRTEAQAIVGDAARRAAERGRSLREELESDSRAGLGGAALDRLFDVTTATGAADVLVERALDRYHEG